MDENDDIKQGRQQAAEAVDGGGKKPVQPAEAVREQTREDDDTPVASYTLRKILGGDFLTADVMRKQIGVIILVAFMTMIYVSNRYSCQQDLIEINDLRQELKDAKYKALASSSELTEICRESHVLEMLRNNEDSVLHISNQPPYIITVPENE